MSGSAFGSTPDSTFRPKNVCIHAVAMTRSALRLSISMFAYCLS